MCGYTNNSHFSVYQNELINGSCQSGKLEILSSTANCEDMTQFETVPEVSVVKERKKERRLKR